jgi:alginate O-acetyltransferase complex protein AlgI
MLFNSFEYLVLLAVSLVAYWSVPWLKARQLVVFAASVWFYMSWSGPFLVMLLFLVAVNWVIGFLLQRDGRRLWLVLGCVVNLGLLAYFKYAKFIAENIAAFAGMFRAGAEAPHLEIILPLGISFYVFELISYLADVHSKRVAHERNILAFSLFVLYFPHLIAGPICRAGQFIPQVNTLQRMDAARLYNGCYMFLAGFALKVGIADGLAPFVNVIFASPGKYSGLDNLMAALGFGVQILCDFWGYSLMALGAALMFGFVLPHNFNAPYAALSIRDFWRRWHITLSNWLRDYLYIALGGSRTSAEWKVQRNLSLTMLLGGLWHGASWNFVIWGAIHGAALAAHRGFDRSPSVAGPLRRLPGWTSLSWLLTMVVVFVAWIFFRAAHFSDAVSMTARIFTPAPDWTDSRIGAVFFELLLLYLPLQWLVHSTTYESDMAAKPLWWQMPAVSLLTLFATVYYVDGNQFIYFQF